MGGGILSGIFWGSMTSVVLLGGVSLVAPLPDAANSGERPTATVAQPLSNPTNDAAPDAPEAAPSEVAAAAASQDSSDEATTPLSTGIELPAGSEFARAKDDATPAAPQAERDLAESTVSRVETPSVDAVASAPQVETAPAAQPAPAVTSIAQPKLAVNESDAALPAVPESSAQVSLGQTPSTTPVSPEAEDVASIDTTVPTPQAVAPEPTAPIVAETVEASEAPVVVETVEASDAPRVAEAVDATDATDPPVVAETVETPEAPVVAEIVETPDAPVIAETVETPAPTASPAVVADVATLDVDTAPRAETETETAALAEQPSATETVVAETQIVAQTPVSVADTQTLTVNDTQSTAIAVDPAAVASVEPVVETQASVDIEAEVVSQTDSDVIVLAKAVDVLPGAQPDRSVGVEPETSAQLQPVAAEGESASSPDGGETAPAVEGAVAAEQNTPPDIVVAQATTDRSTGQDVTAKRIIVNQDEADEDGEVLVIGGGASDDAPATTEETVETTDAGTETNDGATEAASDTAPNVFETAPGGAEGVGVRVNRLSDRADGVKVNRLPSIGGTDAETETPATEGTAEAAPAVDSGNALERNAVAFENPRSKPLFSIVLIDVGGIGIERDTLKSLKVPVTFAVDPTQVWAADAAAEYRDAGFEVVILPGGLPAQATPQDLEVVMGVHMANVPGAVAVLDLPKGGIQDDKDLTRQMLAVTADTGHGMVFYDKGFNSAFKEAEKAGQSAALVFRGLDDQQERASVVRRYLDRAVFKAGQDGEVIMVGHSYPETITALIEWAVEGRAEQVALAPISAILKK